MYAEQKEEEVKILEHSVEELECTINVLEKKVSSHAVPSFHLRFTHNCKKSQNLSYIFYVHFVKWLRICCMHYVPQRRQLTQNVS